MLVRGEGCCSVCLRALGSVLLVLAACLDLDDSLGGMMVGSCLTAALLVLRSCSVLLDSTSSCLLRAMVWQRWGDDVWLLLAVRLRVCTGFGL